VARLTWRDKKIPYTTAIFRQINQEKVAAHHDALEFPNGEIVLLTLLTEGQRATVLQLPAGTKAAEMRGEERTLATVI
jgi:hypothetical protein